jgi:hypothetical protein
MAAGKPRVVLLPFQIFAGEQQQTFLRQGLRSMFISRLKSEGLDLVPEETTLGLLTEEDKQGVQSEERAEALAKQAGADYVIFGSVTGLGGGYSLDLAIANLKKNPPHLTHISEASDQDQLIPKLADIAYQFRAVIEGVDYQRFQTANSGPGGLQSGEGTMGLFFTPTAGSYGFKPTGYTSIRTAVFSSDVGDLEGDGIADLVMVSKDRLLIATRDDDTLVMKDTMGARTGEIFLHVSVGDMDNNGKDEIYLVSHYSEMARSVVYTWSGKGRFRQIAETGGHLNTVKDFLFNRHFLLYQGSRTNKAFSGDIYYMELGANGSLKRAKSLPIEDVQIYTIALTDLNQDGQVDLLGLDQSGYLHVWDTGGAVLWKGTKRLNGTNNKVDIGNRASPGDLPPSHEVNPRVLVADIDKNGSREVIVVSNIASLSILDRLKIYKTSKLIAYKVEGSTLEQAWVTQEIRYAMADIQQDKGTIYLVGQKGQYSKVSAGSSRIMWFE